MKKKVEDLQERQVSTTPLEVLEERRREAVEDVRKISKGETLYAKVVESISTIWDVILEDATAENIRENMHKANDKIGVEKVEMKKLLFPEKVTKMTKIK